MTEADLTRHLDLACRLADAAGEVVRRHFRRPFTVETKADASPVTVADREAEAAMRRILAREVPDHRIIGEEHGRDARTDGPVWVLDPVDGTKMFVTGRPMFGTLVALLLDGRPVLSVIDQPVSGDRWVGCRGVGAFFNGRRLRPRPRAPLARAVGSTTSPEMFRSEAERAAWSALRERTAFWVWGGDCIGYALMASGYSDLVLEADLEVYDYLPLVPVLEEAGACIGDWRGRPLGLDSDGRVLAAGDAALFTQALDILAAATAAGGDPGRTGGSVHG